MKDRELRERVKELREKIDEFREWRTDIDIALKIAGIRVWRWPIETLNGIGEYETEPLNEKLNLILEYINCEIYEERPIPRHLVIKKRKKK